MMINCKSVDKRRRNGVVCVKTMWI